MNYNTIKRMDTSPETPYKGKDNGILTPALSGEDDSCERINNIMVYSVGSSM